MSGGRKPPLQLVAPGQKKSAYDGAMRSFGPPGPALAIFVALYLGCGSNSDTSQRVTSTGGTQSSAPKSCAAPPETVNGHATWYETTGAFGACAYDYDHHQYFAAMNEDDYRSAAACGTCVRIGYQAKTLDVAIVDLCPYQGNETWCYPGGHHLDLGRAAFAYFADPSQGVLSAITWSYVACQVQGGITYTFKAESSQWWAEVLVGNFPYEITKLEYEKDGSFVALERQSYNYFSAANGMGPGPFTFRVTDIHGSTVTDSGVALDPGGTSQGQSNFGLCGSS